MTILGCRSHSAVSVSALDSDQENNFEVLFTDVAFRDNGADIRSLSGSALRLETCLEANCSKPSITVKDCIFTGNKAVRGGSIYSSECNLAVLNSVFHNNQAVIGGAIYISGGNQRLKIRNSSFQNNSAFVVPDLKSLDSPSISTKKLGLGGAIASMNLSSVVIRRSSFQFNSGYGGGGALAVTVIASTGTANRTFTFNLAHSVFQRNVAFDRDNENNRFAQLTANNYGNSGGAMLGLIKGTLDLKWTIRNSTFARNFAYNGGALYLYASKSSLVHRVINSDFRNNRARAGAGAILVAQCDFHLLGTRLYRNAALYGGAIIAGLQSKLLVGPSPSQKRRTVFRENESFLGGGCHIVDGASGRFTDVHFIKNFAYDRAGALSTYAVRAPTVFQGGVFKENRAVTGGALGSGTGWNLAITSHNGMPARFVNNLALVGGAIYFQEGHGVLIRLHLEDAIFEGNKAVSYDDPRIPNIRQLTKRILRADFLQANAVLEDQMDASQRLYTEKLDTPYGSGGAIAFSLNRLRPLILGEITFRNLTIQRNEAIIGGLPSKIGRYMVSFVGGVALYMNVRNSWNVQTRRRCVAREFSVYNCQTFIFQNVRITRNEAEFGGGLFVTSPWSIDFTCDFKNYSNRGNLQNVMARRIAENRHLDFRKDLFCTDIHNNEITGKKTAEAADIGTTAMSLAFESPDHKLRETASGDPLTLSCESKEDGRCDRTVKIAIKDAFNQTIHGGIEDASKTQHGYQQEREFTLDLTIALSSPFILGDRKYSARNGIAVINNTFAFGINVSCSLRISSVGRSQVEMNATFSIRGCHPGEYTFNSHCMRCQPRHYGFNGSRESCETCDEHAVCEGGAALVPEDGYWHSNPFSPFFCPCIVRKGCEYKGRRQQLTAFYSDTKKVQENLERLDQYLAGNGPVPEFPSYKQCADGYEDVLCGACSVGYGHSFSGECKKCPDQDVAARLFLTLSFFWTVIVIGLNCAMTLNSTTARTQLVFEDIKEAALARRPRFISRSKAMSTERRNTTYQPTGQKSLSQSIDINVQETPEGVRDVLLATVQLTETLKILVNYLQVTSAALMLQSDWGPGVETLLTIEANLVGFVSGSFVVPLECNFDAHGDTPRSIAALWTRCSAPSAAMIFLIGSLVIYRTLIYPLINKLSCIPPKASSDADVNDDGTESGTYSLLTGAIVIMIVSIYFSYINVVSQFLRSVNCIEVDHDFQADSHNYGHYAFLDQDKVWAEDTSLRCFEGKHLSTGIAGIIGLGFSALVILIVIIWLPLNKHRLSNSTFVARYWFIYQAYKREWYSTSWEAMILIRKALVTAVVVFAVQLGPTLQAPLCVGILILAHSLHTLSQPFREDQQRAFVPEYFGTVLKFFRAKKWVPSWISYNNSISLNALEAGSIASSILVFFSAIIFGSPSTTHTGIVAMAILTVFFNGSFLVYMIYRLYAGFHVLLDYKLEVEDTAFLATYPNSPGLFSAFTKCIRVAKARTSDPS